MKQMKRVYIPMIAAALLFSLGCEDGFAKAKKGKEKNKTPAAAESAPAFEADFGAGASSVFEKSDGWTNGGQFNCTWRPENIQFNGGVMTLSIDKDPKPLDKIPYSGAEYRTKAHYLYGRYDVVMKPIKNDGVVSSFFTYTGPYDKDPWDEIDIEFLGKDTTIVQFNYFRDGKGNHEYIYKLGFDASEEWHTYSFEWHNDRIAWFVDGFQVHEVKGGIGDIPLTAGKIMMNTWPGIGVDGWLNKFDGKVPLTAQYKSVKFTPFDESKPDAKASKARKAVTAITAPDAGWIRYLKDTQFSVGTDWQEYKFAFTMNAKDDANGRLEYNLGNLNSTATFSLRNVRVEEVQ